ncbi:MAG: gamma-glutamyltransferase family protein [Myxococcota bacterium]
MKRWMLPVGIALLVVLFLFLSPIGGRKDDAPEGSTGRRQVAAVDPAPAMAVAAHPLASQAGGELLARGGSAADAAVAIQAMLTLVEPQSSGLGGGAFALAWDARRQVLEAWDGREVAPAGAGPELFLDADGEPLGFLEALVGGRSVGVPGVLAMLAALHQSQGVLPWATLFQPAIEAAEEGFEVTPRLHSLLTRDPVFRLMPMARALYYPAGRAREVGDKLRNPELAEVLRRIAKEGPAGLYEGPVATAIVEAVKSAVQPEAWKLGLTAGWRGLGLPGDLGLVAGQPFPGALTREDLRAYRPETRTPLCLDYRAHRVCGLPPPSGALAVLQILSVLEHFETPEGGPRSAEAVHLLAEASRLAFADRNAYYADPAFIGVPITGLLDPSYVAERAGLVALEQAMESVQPGRPPGFEGRTGGGQSELPSTSHFSVVDDRGNLVSMTTSVENVFGSRVVVKGMVLNNQLTDFSFRPRNDAGPIANAPEAGKRPRSSMSPIIVFGQDDEPLLAVGSPGGSRIIGYVVDTIVSVLDHGLDAQAAVEMPHVVCRGGAVEVEATGWSKPEDRTQLAETLRGMGHEVKETVFTSGLHVLQRTEKGWIPGIDPRREGRAVALRPD